MLFYVSAPNIKNTKTPPGLKKLQWAPVLDKIHPILPCQATPWNSTAQAFDNLLDAQINTARYTAGGQCKFAWNISDYLILL